MLIQKSAELNIDLNVEDEGGWTPFHFAYKNGHSKIVEIIIHNFVKINIDLN